LASTLSRLNRDRQFRAGLRGPSLATAARMTSLDTPRDIAQGIGGAFGMLFDLLTPFLRPYRAHWGLSAEEAAASFVGDSYVVHPNWMWTHAVQVAAEPKQIWPWVAQIGQDKAGFYAYQWLENLAGCRIRNADTIHPEWAVSEVGQEFRIHPNAPPLVVAELVPWRHFLVTTPNQRLGLQEEAARAEGGPKVSWLFLVQPLREGQSRVVSRYRIAHGRDLRTRLTYGPSLLEPIGFAMDRQMLLGIKERAERGPARLARRLE
jgi:hypothetical protein